MKEIEKTIMVPACEICGKEISSAVKPFEIVEKKPFTHEWITYFFHQECVDKLLIDTAKKLKYLDK